MQANTSPFDNASILACHSICLVELAAKVSAGSLCRHFHIRMLDSFVQAPMAPARPLVSIFVDSHANPLDVFVLHWYRCRQPSRGR